MGGSSSVEAAVSNNTTIQDSTTTATTTTTTQSPPKCKACCACPETKRARDQCIVENGQENCTELIEKHKECMRNMGFNI